MRIAIVLPHLEVGGAQTQAVRLAQDLSSRGHSIFLLYFEEKDREVIDDRPLDDLGFVPILLTDGKVLPLLARASKLPFFRALGSNGEAGRFFSDAFLRFWRKMVPEPIRVVLTSLAGKLISPVSRFFGIDERIWSSIPRGRLRLFVGIFRRPNLLLQVKLLSRAQKRLGLDMLISMLTKTNLVSILSGRSNLLPVIVSERNDFLRQPLRPGVQRMRELLYPLASEITANTEFATRALAEAFPASHVSWLPNRYSNVPGGQNNDSREKKILTLSRMEPQKRVSNLIEAFLRTLLFKDGWRLDVYGAGSELNFVSTRYSLPELGIAIRGHVENTRVPFEKYVFLLVGSQFEGSSNSIHEGVARGLIPFVSRDVEEVRSILRPELQSLLVFDDFSFELPVKLAQTAQLPIDMREKLQAQVYADFAMYWLKSEEHRNHWLASF